MPHSSGFMGHGHPRSRDWGLPDFPCRRADCICNRGNHCVIPSKCVIGEDGRCEGYTPEGKMRVQNEKPDA